MARVKVIGPNKQELIRNNLIVYGVLTSIEDWTGSVYGGVRALEFLSNQDRRSFWRSVGAVEGR